MGNCFDDSFFTSDQHFTVIVGFRRFVLCVDLVAGLRFLIVHLVIAQALDLEVRRIHVRFGQQDDVDAFALFDLGDGGTFLVEQERGDRDGQYGTNLRAAVLHGLFFDQAQDGQRQGAHVTDGALAVAARADHAAGFTQRWAQALTGHLHQTKARDAADLYASAIQFERLTHTVLNFALVAGRRHVDEVDDD